MKIYLDSTGRMARQVWNKARWWENNLASLTTMERRRFWLCFTHLVWGPRKRWSRAHHWTVALSHTVLGSVMVVVRLLLYKHFFLNLVSCHSSRCDIPVLLAYFSVPSNYLFVFPILSEPWCYYHLFIWYVISVSVVVVLVLFLIRILGRCSKWSSYFSSGSCGGGPDTTFISYPEPGWMAVVLRLFSPDLWGWPWCYSYF